MSKIVTNRRLSFQQLTQCARQFFFQTFSSLLMSFRNSFRGWFGEQLTSLMFWSFLDGKTYRQLNNITLVLGDGSTTQIDHLVISKFGIFVIETKNMSGWIFGSERDAQWTQSFPNGKKFRFQNPIRQNYRHQCAIIEFLNLAMPDLELSNADIESKLFSVVFFGPDAKIKTPGKLPDGVNVGAVRYIKSKQEQVFSGSQVDQMAETIRNGKLPNGLVAGVSTRKRHVASLKRRHDVAAGDSCPRCTGKLVVRKRKSDAKEFLGCSKFPKCRFTKRTN